jgi:hypothetical protein
MYSYAPSERTERERASLAERKVKVKSRGRNKRHFIAGEEGERALFC